MGNPVKSSDLFTDDLFDNAIAGVQALNAEYEKNIALSTQMLNVSAKQGAKIGDINDSAGLEAHNKFMADATAKLENHTKAELDNIKVNQAFVKLQKDKLALSEAERRASEAATKAQEKATKEQQKANSVYQQAVTQLAALKKQLKDLEVAGQGQAHSTSLIRAEYDALNLKVRSAEQSVGEFQRNVGNYPDINEKYAVSLTKLSRGLKGLGGLGRLLSQALGIDPAIADGLREAGRAIKEIHHAEGLSNVVTTEGTVAQTANTAAVETNTAATEANIAAKEEESVVSNLALGVWGLVVVAILAASYAIYEWANNTKDSTEAWANQNETIKEFRKELIKLNDEITKGNIDLEEQRGILTKYQAEQARLRQAELTQVGDISKKVRDETKKIKDGQVTWGHQIALAFKSLFNSDAYVDDAIKAAKQIQAVQKEGEKVIEAGDKLRSLNSEKSRIILKARYDDIYEEMQSERALLKEQTEDKRKQLDIQLQMELATNEQEDNDLIIQANKKIEIWDKYYKSINDLAFAHEKAMKKISDDTINQTAGEAIKQATSKAQDSITALKNNKDISQDAGLYSTAQKDVNTQFNSQQDDAKEKEKQQEQEANDTITNTEELNAKIAELQQGLDDKISDIDRARYESLFSLEEEYAKKQDENHKKELKRLQEEADAIIDFAQQTLTRKDQITQQQLDNDLDMRSRAIAQQEQLAALGLNNTLAYQQAAAAKDELAKEQLAIKEKKREQELVFLKLLAAYASSSSSNPDQALGKALTQMAMALAIGGKFFEGTEKVSDSLNGNKNIRDGYTIGVDGSERIMTGAQNAMIGDMTNPELAQLAMMYNTGSLGRQLGDEALNSTLVLKLVDEIQDFKRLVKDRPVSQGHRENNGDWIDERITNGLNSVVRTKNRSPYKSRGNNMI